LPNLWTSTRHLCLRRNKQRTTAHTNTLGNKKMEKGSDDYRRNQRQGRGPRPPSPKTQNLLCLRRNSKKRRNSPPRRPQRQSQILPCQSRLPRRKRRSSITKYSDKHERTQKSSRSTQRTKTQKTGQTDSQVLSQMRKPQN